MDDMKNYGGLLFTLQTRRLPDDQSDDWTRRNEDNTEKNQANYAKKETAAPKGKASMPSLSIDQKIKLEKYLRNLKEVNDAAGSNRKELLPELEDEMQGGRPQKDEWVTDRSNIPMKHHIAWMNGKRKISNRNWEAIKASTKKDLPKVLNPMNWKQMILDLLKLRKVENDDLESSSFGEESKVVPGLSWKRVEEYQVPGLTWKKREDKVASKEEYKGGDEKLMEENSGALNSYDSKSSDEKVPALPWKRNANILYDTKESQKYKDDAMLEDLLEDKKTYKK